MDRAKAIERVKKLIAVREHAERLGNSEATAEAHAAELQALASTIGSIMRAYRIEEHEVADAPEDDYSDYGMTLVTAYTRGTAVPWQAFLFNIIAESQACQCVVIRENGHFFVAGRTLDRAVTVALARQLAASIDTLSLRSYVEAQYGDPAVLLGMVSEDEYVTSFRTGFMQALQHRLQEEEQKEIAAAGETALMVISKAVQKTQRFLDTRIAGGVNGTVDVEIEMRHRGAAEEGYEAGMQANLSANTLTGTATQRKAIE